MSEIPIDVRKAADALTEASYIPLLGQPIPTAHALIMKAIVAERERCAGVFERRAETERNMGNAARANQYEWYAELVRSEAAK